MADKPHTDEVESGIKDRRELMENEADGQRENKEKRKIEAKSRNVLL